MIYNDFSVAKKIKASSFTKKKKKVDVNICYSALCHVSELTLKAKNIVMMNYFRYCCWWFKKINQDLKQRGRRITATWAETSSQKEAFNMSSQISDAIKVYMKIYPPKNFLNFGNPKTSFSPSEMFQRLGTSKRPKKGWWRHVTSVSLLSHCFRFWSSLCPVWN